ncbi:MAG: hypothetical protein HY650_08095 [Acidobacteria bacterium]|nr:hypothetical protein [Acidobacteriota bacterium]
MIVFYFGDRTEDLMRSRMAQKLDRLLLELPENSLPPVIELVERLSHQTRRGAEARTGKTTRRKKQPGPARLSGGRQGVELLLREEVGFGIMPAPLALVQHAMAEDVYDLE